MNLLPSQAKFQVKKMRLKKIVNMTMICIGAVWLFLIAIVLVTQFVVNTQVSAAENNYNKSVSTLKSLSDTILVNQEIKFRAKEVGQILSQRFEYGKALNKILTLFQEGNITISNYDIQEARVIHIIGIAQDKDGMNLLEKKVLSINRGDEKDIASAELGSLGFKDGVWNFSLEIIFK
ncbi:MAG TPA: hypothetical protein VF828_03120 [Patescibacteria group bacterium]